MSGVRSCMRLEVGFSSSSTRTCQKAFARELESCNGLFASNGRKLPEKLVQRVTTLDVVKERLDGDAVPTNTGVPLRISGSLCTTGVSLDMTTPV